MNSPTVHKQAMPQNPMEPQQSLPRSLLRVQTRLKAAVTVRDPFGGPATPASFPVSRACENRIDRDKSRACEPR